MTSLPDAVARQIERARPKLSTAKVDEIDTSTSPDTFTVGGRKMACAGPAPAVGDLVVVLTVGPQSVCLGAVVDS